MYANDTEMFHLDDINPSFLVEDTNDNDLSTWTTVSDYNVTRNPNGVNNPHVMSKSFEILYTMVFVPMIVVATGGNVIVIWIVTAHKRMRTVTNYFLVNLAVADVSISVLNTAFNFVYMVFGDDWRFGRNYCKFAQFIGTASISANVFTFMAIACDRYLAIIHPLRPRMSAVVVLCVIGVIWAASALLSLPNLLYAEIYVYIYEIDERTICWLDFPDKEYSDFAYSVFLMIANYVVPLAVLFLTYTLVGVKLWGSQAIGERTTGQEERIQSKRKVVKMMIVVVVIFALCWLPQHVYFVISHIWGSVMVETYFQHVYLIIYWIAMSNSMYNPILYCWMNASFRNGFKNFFRCYCRRQSNDTMGHGRGNGDGGGSTYEGGGHTGGGGKGYGGGKIRLNSLHGTTMYRLAVAGENITENTCIPDDDGTHGSPAHLVSNNCRIGQQQLHRVVLSPK